MRHFGIGQWTDFVRGTAAEAETAAMEEHLQSGCESCLRVLASLRAVEAGGRGRSAPEPAQPVSKEQMELVWDSALAPLQLSDAGPAESGRQLNFATAEFELSVHLEGGEGDDATVLLARLQSRLDHEVGGLEVVLTGGRQVIDSTTTGEIGEFELSLDTADPVELSIAIDDEHRLLAGLADA